MADYTITLTLHATNYDSPQKAARDFVESLDSISLIVTVTNDATGESVEIDTEELESED